ncbi:MAG: ribbon-helix-helix protein, CopG family [Pseudomonadota bacterium]
MLGIRLEPELELRLERLAEQTGRTKSYYAREAIRQYLDSCVNVEEARRQSLAAASADRAGDWELGADDSGWTA